MRLDVHKTGVKLFFITFAVVGRQPILSQLVDEKSRPALLPLGEWVKEALRRLKAERRRRISFVLILV